MRNFRLFLTVVVLTTLTLTHVHARAVGDRFTGYIKGTTTRDGVIYQVTSIEEGNLTVSVYETALTGAITFRGEIDDSTSTTFKVTSVVSRSDSPLFTNRAAVTSVTFQENFRHLPMYTLWNISNLTTINLPASLETYERAFADLSKLTTINIAAGNTHFKKDGNNNLYSADGTVMYFYNVNNSATTFSVPAGVTRVENTTFRSARLTSITFPASLTTFEAGAIVGCGNLTTLNVAAANTTFSSVGGMLCSKDGTVLYCCPQGKSGTVSCAVKTVKELAFYGCGKITILALPNVETMEVSAINTCTSMTEIRFGSALTTYGSEQQGVMGYNIALQKITFTAANPNFTTDANGVMYSKDFTKLFQMPSARTGSYATHAETKIICANAFTSSRLSNLVITNKCEEIRDGGISISNLSSVTFNEPAVLKKIGRGAFYSSQLTDIVIPASVDTIGSRAFDVCTKLRTVNLKSGSKLAWLGESVFNGCTALETFKFIGTHTAPSLTIGDHAFRNCAKLASGTNGEFTFPTAVDSIGVSAFNGCTSMTAATFQETMSKKPSIKSIGFAAFQNSGLLDITIPDSVTFIGNQAFNSCQKLKTVSIPAATIYVGPQAFLFCGSLMEVLFDKNNPNYSSVDGMFASKDKKTLYSFPAGKAATYYTMLSPSFETINDSAFYYCRDLKSVTIPKKVTKIGAHAFAICNNLERINFLTPNPITDVHEEAFVDMNKNSLLKNIDIYVRKDCKGSYEGSSFWGKDAQGRRQSKSINEAFLATDSKGSVEYFPMSPTDVSIVDVHSDVTTFVVPQTVTNTADNKTYSVKFIGDYAFEGNTTDIEEVVVPSNVTLNYIGACAFIKANSGMKPIKNIFVVNATPADLATSTFGLHDAGVTGNYDEIEDGQTIYVKKSAETAFKTAWDTMADKISYRIPGMKISKTYGTFAREFDVNLADYFETNGTGRVYAFTSNAGGIQPGTGDVEGNPTNYYIRMRSINEGQEGDGTYIPAGTGVLLKTMGGASATASDFYYTIGEKDVNAAAASTMVGVTRSPEKITASATSPRYFVVSGGNLKEVKNQSVWIPAHKAYLKLDNMPAGAKLMFLFNDDVTSIDRSQLAVEGSANGDIFDLQGRKVTAPTKGIYIKNGKKIIIK